MHWVLARVDRTFKQQEFLNGWMLVHDDLDDFESRLETYRSSDDEVRRAARVLLERQIERRRPGKADAIRAVALSTAAPVALVGVGIWSDWSAAMYSNASGSGEPVVVFAEYFSPTLQAFLWVVGVLLVILYLWVLFTWGADKARGTHLAWLQVYREHESAEAARRDGALVAEQLRAIRPARRRWIGSLFRMGDDRPD